MTMMIQTPIIEKVLNDLQLEFGKEKIAPLIKLSDRWKERYVHGSSEEWTRTLILEAISFVA